MGHNALMRMSAKVIGVALLVLGTATVLAWDAAWYAAPTHTLKVSFLDTGEGNVVLVRAPSGRTMLIDGGKGSGVVRAVAAQLPWFVHSVDVVVLSQPDQSHASGLIDVLGRYRVGMVVAPSNKSANPIMETFERTLSDAIKRGTRSIEAKRGESIDLGGGAVFVLLFPDRDLSYAPAKDDCVVGKLSYGDTSFLFSCGNTGIEEYLARLDGTVLRATVQSEGEGAATSSASELFNGFVSAQFVATSSETFVSDGTKVSVQ